jgi:hypothetical protein
VDHFNNHRLDSIWAYNNCTINSLINKNKPMDKTEQLQVLATSRQVKAKRTAAEFILKNKPTREELKKLIDNNVMAEEAWLVYGNDLSAASKEELIYIKENCPFRAIKLTADELLTWKFNHS